MAAQHVERGSETSFRFINPMPNGPIKIRFCADDNRLEIDLPCDDPRTVNRLYVEHADDGFSVYSHNHTSPGGGEEREINALFD